MPVRPGAGCSLLQNKGLPVFQDSSARGYACAVARHRGRPAKEPRPAGDLRCAAAALAGYAGSRAMLAQPQR